VLLVGEFKVNPPYIHDVQLIIDHVSSELGYKIAFRMSAMTGMRRRVIRLKY
jgi:hypothetical protein